MKFRRLMLVAILLLVGCSKHKAYTIYNGCYGTWAEVYRGNNTILVQRVDYGRVAPAELSAWAGTRVELIAVLHELTSNRVVGHARDWVTIPRSYNSPDLIGPDDIQIWAITHLWDSNWDCRSR